MSSLGTDSVSSAAHAHAAVRRPPQAGPADTPEASFDEMLESALPDRSVPDRTVPERAARDPSAPPPTAPERAVEPDPTAPAERESLPVVRSESETTKQPKADPAGEPTDGDALSESAKTDILLAALVPTVPVAAAAVVPVTVTLTTEAVAAADGSAVPDVLAAPANPAPVPGGDPALTPVPPTSPATPAVTTPAAVETAAVPEVEAVEAAANPTIPLRTAEQNEPAVPAEPQADDAPTVADRTLATSELPAARKAPADLPTTSNIPADQPVAAKDERPVQAAVKPTHDQPAPESGEPRAEPETKPDKLANPHTRQADVSSANTKPASAPSDAPASQSPPAGNPPQQDPVQPLTLTPASATVMHGHAAAAPAANGANAAAAYAPAVALAGLAVEIVARAREGNNRFEIRLDPPELGRIDVHLLMDRDGNVTSRLYVERSETLDLLRRDAPQLERALNQAGLKASGDGMEFSLRDQGFGRDPASRQESSPNRLIIADETQPATTAASSFYGRRLGLGGGLDIRV